MKITKLEAAGAQLDAAIDYFLRGDWVVAIHCAGAAEELCGRYSEAHGGATMPNSIWAESDFSNLVPNKKEFVAVLNLYRDWVKHTNESHPSEMDIEDWQAHFYVQRAVNSYGQLLVKGDVLPRKSIARMGEWFDANEARLEQIVNSLRG